MKAEMLVRILDDAECEMFSRRIDVRVNSHATETLRNEMLRAALSELSAQLDEWLDGEREGEAPILDAADLAAQVARDLRRRQSHKSFAPTEPAHA